MRNLNIVQSQELIPETSQEKPLGRRPEWLKVRMPSGKTYKKTLDLVKRHDLHTVCESARCPNMGECWAHGTATFMILGDVCTRSCGFCAVKTGKPEALDYDEPARVADAIQKMGVRYAVITSVNRDDQKLGGADIFAETIRLVRQTTPHVKVEVLIPDFMGNWDALQRVIDAKPDVLNHNIESVPRLYFRVRPQAKYPRTLELLQRSKDQGLVTKSGLMVGIGEHPDEVIEVMHDLRNVGVDIITIGQYLQPSKMHLPVDRFVHPDEFKLYEREGYKLGFQHVASGPLVRSSYHADLSAKEIGVYSG